MTEPPELFLPAWDTQEPEAPGRSPRAVTLRILGVSEVTRLVRDAIRADRRLVEAWVEGEVGRVTVSSAGHAYFTLKDERSQLSCVFFRDDRLVSPFEPRAGLRVVARGRVDVFEQQGVYQLYVSALQPAGFGDLALRYEALKAALAAEGLFDARRKRPVPSRPAVIGVVTSPSGAAWHDIRTVLERRWPRARVVLAPAAVQGPGAPEAIIAALGRLARWGELCHRQGRPSDAPAVVILARGGGSLEDLWSFNDERVVRAVAAHPVPVVCGVGHEVDVTLADFAADLRAPTPSAAAELVTPSLADERARLQGHRLRLDGTVGARLADIARELEQERRVLDRLRPGAQLAAARERAGFLLDRATSIATGDVAAHRRVVERAGERLLPLGPARTDLARRLLEGAGRRLPASVAGRLAGARSGLAASAAALGALAPQATLDRGYAIVRRTTDLRIIRDPAEAPAGTDLVVRIARGTLGARSLGMGEGAPGPRSAGAGNAP